MSTVLIIPAIIAAAVPLAYLYMVHWLDLYSSDRPKLILLALVWGALASGLAYVVNHPMAEIFGRPFVAGRTAPIVEEILKALVLVYLVRRADFTYFVDGAIYGFASGTGFAVAENMVYLNRYDPSSGLLVAVIRVFSSALLHGTATGIVGAALGRVRFSRGKSQLLYLVLALAVSISLHLTFNNIGLLSTDERGVYLLVGIGLAGLGLISGFVLWGLREERGWLRETLNTRLGVSEEEANIVQHMGDLEELLAPVAQRFGKNKRDQVARFLHVEAQLGLKREVQAKTMDPQQRAAIQNQIAQMEVQLDKARREVGVYVMTYVRSILPPTQWSIWVRAAQALATKQILLEPSVWRTAENRIAAHDGRVHPTAGIYGRVQHELVTRAEASTQTLPVHELPEPMRESLDWVIQHEEVTLDHLAKGLRHEEATAHAILTHLTDRGFLEKRIVNGETRYRARAAQDGENKTRANLWQGLHTKIQIRAAQNRTGDNGSRRNPATPQTRQSLA